MSQTERKSRVVNTSKRRSLLQWTILAVFSTASALLFAQFGPNWLATLGDWVTKKFTNGAEQTYRPPEGFLALLPVVAAGVLVGWFIATLLLRVVEKLGSRWEKTDDSEKLTWFVGTVIGFLVATFFINFLLAMNLSKVVVVSAVGGIGILFTTLSVYALHTMKETLPWYRGKVRARRTGIKILDTNVIIDGRVYDVARAGFVEGQIYVPQFVLEELQYIADSHDPLRRQRGKRGLDILKLMQAEFSIEVGIHDRLAPEQKDGVDSRLVRLATALGGDLVTNDHNLNRVATLQEVRVLNINDLALSLRPNVLPQERLELHIVREGNQMGQGVGYLEDGTMVIVENGRPHIGETLEVMVTQVIQTERGKLIFGEVEGEPTEGRRAKPRRL